ncbi:helix-turn-helix domain-containing protein [Marinicella sp. W31]|uniref:helix-turn-helix transcriptional regulator n=1 Tax=Marinicella sp. W31 TaxID=3023713 RepID=UPI003757B0D6
MQTRKIQSVNRYILPQLQQHVESVQFFKGYEQQQDTELVFGGHPEGIFELVFQNTPSIWQSNDFGESWGLRDEALVGGLHQNDYRLQLSPESEMTVIRFRLGSFKYFVSEKLHEFTDRCVAVTDIWGQRGQKLHDRLNLLSREREKLLTIGKFLQEEFNRSQQSVIDEAVKKVVESRGIIDLKSLEQLSCLSPAQFRKRFREEVGLSPKKYAKIIRINALLRELNQVKEKKQLTDLAYRYHYYDQSHFIKDFKSVVGQTPSRFLSAQAGQ